MATDETLPLEDRDEAAKQLEALADGGDRYAQYLTGILYRDGGLLIPDTEKAQHYLELAARQDHVAAQYALGKMLLSDERGTENPHKDFTGWNGRRRAAATMSPTGWARNISAGRTHPKKPGTRGGICAHGC